jgi:hypothetical protein
MLMRIAAGILLILAVPVAGRAEGVPSFEKDIAPLLARRCLACHQGDQPKGKLDLATKAGALRGGKHGHAIVPGRPDESLAWAHVESGHMPPKKPLPDTEKALLKRWIAAGARWDGERIDAFRFTTDARAGTDWWSLQPVRRPPLPATCQTDWCRNPIDHFILARLEGHGLKSAPAADRRTLIRRLSFDLLGLPPTPEEVEAFVRDGSPRAYERLVDRLLASPHYGERWARHWLDVARFGESNGFEHDEFRKNAWRYRDWVIDALNRDLPYDEFARLQIAGDVLRPDDPSAVTATGFLVAGPYDTVGQAQQSVAMKAVVRQDELEDLVGTLGQTFLGLTVQCARCHDHKFDPIRQAEYYRLTAALAGVRHGERDITPGEMKRRLAAEVEQRRARLAATVKELAAVERPAREKALAERKQTGAPVDLPEPVARWDFRQGLHDRVGGLGARLEGDATRDATGLHVTGKTGYAASEPLRRDIGARTLAAWVRLDNLAQRGGAAISLQAPDGGRFDAIVFGEREPGRWMAGSENFRRTESFSAPAETDADKRPVHLAITYAADGTITGYRDGRPYGKPYRTAAPAVFAAGQARLVFGVRHTPAQPGRMLAGTVLGAALFDRALTADEVAGLVGKSADFVSEKELVARLSGEAVIRRRALLAEIEALKQALRAPPPGVLTYAVAPRPPEVAHVLVRGQPSQLGAVVGAGGVAALRGPDADFHVPPDAPDADRRRKLAEYITAADNPLFARVIVNRLWQHHFGVGIVDTPSDLGFNGGRPTHPELLDWLASELPRRGWSLKALHRLMVTSATYRQESRFDPAAAKTDAGNRLLWRKSPMRLEAEAARDAVLATTGRLDRARGGPGYQEFQITVRGATYFYDFADAENAAHDRRTIYRAWARSGRNALLDALDCPDPSTTAPRRAVTTTPTQALALLNNRFILRQVEHFAARVRSEAGTDVDRQIERAYRLAYQRAPTAGELAEDRAIVARHGLAVLCRAILNSNEFVYVD